MKSYKEMSREELLAEKAELEKRVEGFKAMNLSLNMTRGKPAPNQLDMSNGLYDSLSKEGFKAAHALKGVSGNLSLTPLYEKVVEITELLRAETKMDYTDLLKGILEEKEKLEHLINE